VGSPWLRTSGGKAGARLGECKSDLSSPASWEPLPGCGEGPGLRYWYPSNSALILFAGGGEHNREGRCRVLLCMPRQSESQPRIRGETTQAKRHFVFCIPQKGETVKRIREQVRMEFGRSPGHLMWRGGSSLALLLSWLGPDKWGRQTDCWHQGGKVPAAQCSSCTRRAVPGLPSPRALAQSASLPSPGLQQLSSMRSP
jgi:hypothetical protein